jgi:hypothetical protein
MSRFNRGDVEQKYNTNPVLSHVPIAPRAAPNSGDFIKPSEERTRVCNFFKTDLSITNATRERPIGIGFQSRQPDRFKVRIG